MPIVIPGQGSPGLGATLTAQSVINGTSQDLRSQLPTNSSILLDYTDRIHREILRTSRWIFLLSPVQQFITEPGITDYWIGTTGNGPQGSIDTGLNLSDVYRLKDDTVLDRSNNVTLFRQQAQPPNFTTFEFPDGQSRLLRPTNFYHDNYGFLLRIFPAPNQQNTYAPTPESPICTTVAGGSLAARTYYVRYSIVDSAGNESDASSLATQIYVPANFLLKVLSPKFPLTSAQGISYAKYNVYASTTQGSETKQSASPIASGGTFTEATTGLINGAAYPTVNNLAKMNGYLIEFRYYQTRSKLNATNSLLQTPDDYLDILISGVNWLGFQFLQKPNEARTWQEIYANGLKEMIRDRNMFNAGDFMRPDVSSQISIPVVPGFVTGF